MNKEDKGNDVVMEDATDTAQITEQAKTMTISEPDKDQIQEV